MSSMGSKQVGRRARRQCSEEFRIGAVRLVLDAGKTVGAVARELDLTPSAMEQRGSCCTQEAELNSARSVDAWKR